MDKKLGFLLAGTLALVAGFAGHSSAQSVVIGRNGEVISAKAPALIDTTTERLVCTGRCLLLGIMRETGPSTTTLAVRDTATTGSSGALKLPFIHFFPEGSQAYINPVNVPILFEKGITAEISSVSAAETVQVFYIDLDP